MVESLKSSMYEIYSKNRTQFASVNSKLITLNPMAVLSRGYGVVYDKENKNIKSSKSVNPDDVITVKLYDGSIKASVIEREE